LPTMTFTASFAHSELPWTIDHGLFISQVSCTESCAVDHRRVFSFCFLHIR
jgi:hypothetical protein